MAAAVGLKKVTSSLSLLTNVLPPPRSALREALEANREEASALAGATVTQNCILLYRGFAIRGPPGKSATFDCLALADCKSAIQQIEICLRSAASPFAVS
jgi:hypothetical protein